jgi:hypothetical protein
MASNCPLVIVDTLVRVRPPRRPGDEPYQLDYTFAAELRALLDGLPRVGPIGCTSLT